MLTKKFFHNLCGCPTLVGLDITHLRSSVCWVKEVVHSP